MSQSVPRDGGYCNGEVLTLDDARTASQSVPRDGGYCNSLNERSLRYSE